MSYFGVSTRNGVGLGLGTVPSLTNTPLGYRLAPSLDLSFAGSDALSPAITFSRTTNATLTNSAGLIANAPMNLLTFSEQFDNAAWTKGNITVNANSTAAPDGATTADTLNEGTATNYHNLTGAVVAAGTYTVSLFAKNINAQYLVLTLTKSAGEYCSVVYDTVGGTVANSTAAGPGFSVSSTSIVSGANGWYRCVMTCVIPNSANFNIGLSNSTTTGSFGLSSYTGTSRQMSVWGAQLELGSTATTYNPTTVKNLLGFTENFDNAAWTKSNAFVQTNLLTYSQDFDNAAWTKSNATIAANSVVAPDGSTTADGLTEDTATTAHSVYRSAGSLTGAYTASCYVKAAGRTWCYMEPLGNTATRTYFNLSGSGSVGTTGSGVTASITAVGNDWYRITTTYTYAAATGFVVVGAATGDAVASYAGNGAIALYFWGAQLVQGTSAGDYKATYAAAAAVGYTDIYGQPFAQKLVENTATSIHSLIQPITPITSTPYTGTLYVKAAERAFAFVGIGQTGNNSFASINLSTGAVSVAFGSPTVSATSIGNGWFRVSVTVASISTASLSLEARVSTDGVWDNRSYTGDGTSGIYIFGAQLSDSASVDPYVYQPVAAPTSTAYYGPRFDYDPVTLASKGLFIEEQRTNLLTYSNGFSTSPWGATASSVNLNAAISPDGTQNAVSLVESSANTQHYVFQPQVVTAQSYTLSAHFKANTRTQAYLDFTGGSNRAVFNLATGVVVSTIGTGLTASITNVGNGWYRCSITQTQAATTIYPTLGTALAGAISYAGNGTSGIYLWGAQLEAGSQATSYIPTVASQVTRAADSASMIGNNFARWYNQTEGTLFSDFDWSGLTSNDYCFSIGTDGNNSIGLGVNTSGISRFLVISGGTSQANYSFSALTPNVPLKLAGAYKLNDFNAAAAGTLGTTDTSGTVPLATSAQFNSSVGGGNDFNGHIKRIAYYNRRLSNTELQGITS